MFGSMFGIVTPAGVVMTDPSSAIPLGFDTIEKAAAFCPPGCYVCRFRYPDQPERGWIIAPVPEAN